MPEKKQPKLYQIHNVSRKQATRTTRRAAAGRTKLTLLLGGGLLKVPRGKWRPVAEPLLRRLLPDLIQRKARGEVKVTHMDGTEIDLATLTPVGPAPAPKPQPAPPQDSAVNDENFGGTGIGQEIPTHEGGQTLNDGSPKPSVLTEQVPEGKEEAEVQATADLETGVVESAPGEEAPEETSEEESEEEEETPEVTDDLVNDIYESATRKDLEAIAKEMGVDPEEGNKTDLARRLAEAGYVPSKE